MNVALQITELATDASGAGYPDYIIAKLKLDGHSQRWLADKTGISRSRLQRVLSGDVTRRKSLRIQEKQAIFTALKVDKYVAGLAVELMNTVAGEDFESTVAIASMLSALFRGLGPQVATALRHIQGFEHHDIKEEYGVVMKEAVIRTIQHNFQMIADRRGLRLDQLLDPERTT